MATIVNTSDTLNNKILKVVSKDYMSNKFTPLDGNQYSDSSTIKTLFGDVITALGGTYTESTAE